MAITWADVVLINADAATLATDRQNAILADVALQMSADAWGSRYDLGSKWLAAHFAAVYVATASGPAGPVIGETIGPASIQFASPGAGGSGGALETTSYGREYMRLAKLNPKARMLLL